MAGVEHKVVLSRPLSTVVDIGANRGQFALAARVISGAKVISFEPLPSPAKRFRQVFASDPQVKLYVAAIGPLDETMTIHISAKDDSSSLLPITALQERMFPGTAEVERQTVEVGPLGKFVSPEDILSPALLKLDVQGFEYNALCGCESLLFKFDFIYCECSFVELYSGQKLAAAVIEWLSDRDFRLTGMFNPAYDDQGQAIQADFFFRRDGVTEYA